MYGNNKRSNNQSLSITKLITTTISTDNITQTKTNKPFLQSHKTLNSNLLLLMMKLKYNMKNKKSHNVELIK